MAMKQSEILGLFTSPADVQAMQQERISQEASMYSDPIARQMYQSAAGVTGGVAGLFGGQPTGAAEAAKIEEIRKSVPFDVENQSQYYTQLGQTLINQGLTKAGIQALELAKQAKLDEAKAAKAANAAKDATGTLGSADKKAIREATTTARQARGRANQAKNLRDRFIKEQPFSGIIGSVIGSFKSFVGGQGKIDLLKKEYEGLRISDGMANLPPGPASDKDVDLALSRFPTADDSPTYIADFLNGIYKASVVDSEYQEFYANYLEQNYGSSAGADAAWKQYASTIDWEGQYGVVWDDGSGEVTDKEQGPEKNQPIELGIGEAYEIDGIVIERIE